MTETVPFLPNIEATVGENATGSIVIDGVSQPVAGWNEQAVRGEILAFVVATANDVGRPVRLTTRDLRGEQLLAVYPDGHVEPLHPDQHADSDGPTGDGDKPFDREVSSELVRPLIEPPIQPAPVIVSAPDESSRHSNRSADLPTLGDLLRSRPKTPIGAATMGWRGAVSKLTGGVIALGPGARELAHINAIERVQRGLRGPRTIVVINPKGGAHKTTASLLLAATFGTYRGGYTLAWDNNETRGTLGWRSRPARHSNTAVDLLRDLGRFNDIRNARVGDLDNYVRSQGSTQFDVLASDEDAAASSTINRRAFSELHTTLSRFYRVIIVDTGNNMRASNWEAAVAAADQLVIVSTIREDTAASAAWLIDGLREKGHEQKVREAVTVLSSPSKVADPQLSRRLHRHFASLTRTVLDVPHDQALVDGGVLDYTALAPSTREAWLQVTAAVSDGL